MPPYKRKKLSTSNPRLYKARVGLKPKRSFKGRKSSFKRVSVRSSSKRKGSYSRGSSKSKRIKMPSRKALLNILTQTDIYAKQYSETIQLLASDATTGRRCVYRGAQGSSPYGAINPYRMRDIAFLINTSANENIKFFTTGYKMKEILSNMSNISIDVVRYVIQARRDLPALPAWTQGLDDAIYSGFLNNNAPVGHTNPSLSLYNSGSFVESWKILSSKKSILGPGKQQTWHMSDNKTRTVHPSQFITMDSGETYGTGNVDINWRRGEIVTMFQLTPHQVGYNTGTEEIAFQAADMILNTEQQWSFKHVDDNLSTITSSMNGVAAAAATVVRPAQMIVQPTPGIFTMPTTTTAGTTGRIDYQWGVTAVESDTVA